MNRSYSTLRMLTTAAAVVIVTPNVVHAHPRIELVAPDAHDARRSVEVVSAAVDGADFWKVAYDWARLHDRIELSAELEPDWDGMDGQPPTRAVIAQALRFLDEAQIAGLALPEAHVAGDGEVSFHWEKGSEIATVSFLDDGHIVAFVSRANGEPFRLDALCNDTAIARLFDRLGRFA